MKRKAFTKVELITLIAITVFLLGISMPTLEKQREDARTILCASQMSQWGQLLFLYAADNHDEIPYLYSNNPDDPNRWYDKLSYYISGKQPTQKDIYPGESPNYPLEFRQCPASTAANPAWIGPHSSTYPGCAPFFNETSTSGLINPPVRIRRILHSGSLFGFLDVYTWMFHSPMLENGYFKFAVDMDNDGMVDSFFNAFVWGAAAMYNGARPRMHTDGANLWMFDGHIEYIKFVDFWASQNGFPTHPFWQFEQK